MFAAQRRWAAAPGTATGAQYIGREMSATASPLLIKKSFPRPTSRRELWVCHLGVVDYRRALAMQEALRARRQREEVPDCLLVLEHPPVYTRGRRARAGDVVAGATQGIEVVDVDRGGKVTFHNPGQLVGYPIVRVSDVVAYVRDLEAAMITALAGEGIEARTRDGLTGVWVGEEKIGSIGVHVSRGVTTHGFALNVANDLEPFDRVVACGLPGVRMTSVARLTGREQPMPCVRRRVALALAQRLGARQRLVSVRRLGL